MFVAMARRLAGSTGQPPKDPSRYQYFERFRSNFRAMREAADLTQAAVAARCGLTQQFINRLEAGRKPSFRPNPTIDTLEDLADALGVDLSDLLRTDFTPPQR